MSTPRPLPHRRDAYVHFQTIPTRWADNDQYGHINNVTYYAFFDTVVNTWLMEEGLLDLDQSTLIGLVVETGCSFFAPAAYPETLQAGLKIAHMGTSSVRYEIAIFQADRPDAIAQGHFIHVYVDGETRQPVPLPNPWRTRLRTLIHQNDKD